MTDQISLIAELNDRCRQGLDPTARIVITATGLATLVASGVIADEHLAQAEVLAALRAYESTPDDGHERSRGVFSVRGQPVHFTIDYYDRSLEWGSEDPADPGVTTRVLTIMLSGED